MSDRFRPDAALLPLLPTAALACGSHPTRCPLNQIDPCGSGFWQHCLAGWSQVTGWVCDASPAEVAAATSRAKARRRRHG